MHCFYIRQETQKFPSSFSRSNFILVAFQLYLYMCAYVHVYTVCKHSSVLRKLLLYAANINFFRQFMLHNLLHVFFGCLFVMLTSVLVADTTVNLENFHTIYTYMFCHVFSCYMLLSFCSHLENVLLCICKIVPGLF